MKREDTEALREILPELSKLHHLSKIRILTLNGRVAFSSDSKETGTVIASSNFKEFMTQEVNSQTTEMHDGKTTVFHSWKKLRNAEVCHTCHEPSQMLRGFSWVETSDTLSLASLQPDLLALIGIPLIVIVLLSLATEIVFVRSVDRPVQKLRKMMNALQGGDFSVRINDASQDELGQLATGMNSMAEKLQIARQRLDEHHRQELSQAESMAKIGELAAGMAHEIKNPISGIVFAANSILRETDLKDGRYVIFKEIVKQANRVEQNLESLLSFARNSRFERFPTDLNAIIERILLFIRQQPDMQSITTESKLKTDLPEALIDPKQIEQVLLNLIINAVQAMSSGGTLTVCTSVDSTSKRIYISVEDTGMGISEDSKNKIFTPFYSTKANGVGLGLMLCKEIITRHNGTISFNSEFGVGTTFTIDIPIGNLEIVLDSLN
jgi:signal transduction histidine kinase